MLGKTDRCVITILNECSNRSNKPMFQHLQHYEKFLKTIKLYQLPNTDTVVNTDSLQAHIASAISDNWKILDSNINLVQFCFLESLYIKRAKPKIDDGLQRD